MEENKQAQAGENKEEPKTAEELKELREQKEQELKELLKEKQEKAKIAREAEKEGKGRLALETPIRARSEDITELVYDFTTLSGMDYIDAMDSDPNSNNMFRISNRQALALFAIAAEKHTEGPDRKDIMQQIGSTDAQEGIYLATSFFLASARAGRLRISKK